MKSLLLRITLYFFFFLPYLNTTSQNLIPNAGFEYYTTCPTDKYHYSPLAIGWINPSKEGVRTTPDFYHSCGEEDYQTPKNRYGMVMPYGGEGYAGLLNRNWWREYITIRLKEPLQPGKEYKASIFVQATDTFGSIIKNIGMHFSKKIPKQKGTKPLKNTDIITPDGNFITPQIKNSTNDYIPIGKWVKIEGTFRAKGGEKFITIGSFGRNVDHKLVKHIKNITDPVLDINTSSNKGSSYIYIDNVNTTPIERPKYKLPVKGEIKKLDYVYFRFDKADLLPASFKELNLLLEIIKRKKLVKIEIIGHTCKG